MAYLSFSFIFTVCHRISGNFQIKHYYRVGDISMMKLLVAHFSETWSTLSNNGRSPLHTAALSGRKRVVDFLLAECNYECNVQDCCGSTPLMECIRSGHGGQLVQILINKGHTLTNVDVLGRNCLHVAAHSGEADIIRDLIIDHGMEPNEPSGHLNLTPLHWAALEGQTRAILCLLENGANPHILDDKGRTATIIGQECGLAHVVEVLNLK